MTNHPNPNSAAQVMPDEKKFDRLYNQTFKGYSAAGAERLTHAQIFWNGGHEAALSKLRAPVADERGAFEALFHRFDLRPSIRVGHYADLRVQFMWEAWKARADRAIMASAPVADERETVHNAAIKAAAKVCADIARQYDPQNNQENALASELYSAGAAILKLVKEDRAAMVSAPADERAPEQAAPGLQYHILKTDPDVFQAVLSGEKTFEIRWDDRGYAVGDVLGLRETKHAGAEMRAGAPLVYTGRECQRFVSHVLTGYGLADGWCCLSFRLPHAGGASTPVDDAGNWQQYRLRGSNETAEQIIERERMAYADLLQSVMDKRRERASAPIAGEAVAEQFIQAAIDHAPEPLRRLGEYLACVLDEDQWATAERMLLAACNAAPQASATQVVANTATGTGDTPKRKS